MVVVKYVILFAVVKMWCLMVMVSIVVRTIMGIVTVMLVAWVPVAVVCISVCVIKQCVSTTKGKRKRKEKGTTKMIYLHQKVYICIFKTEGLMGKADLFTLGSHLFYYTGISGNFCSLKSHKH